MHFRGEVAPVRAMTSWFRVHPYLADALLVAMVGLIEVASTLAARAEATERPTDSGTWILLAMATIPLIWRRRYTVVVLWIVVLTTVTFWMLDYPADSTGLASLIAVYSLGAHTDRPRSLYHFWGVFTITTITVVTGIVADGENVPIAALPSNTIMMATAWILGDNMRTRRQYLKELEEKAARTEAQRAAEAKQAVSEERTRIARELHDVVAHSMSVMVVQAGAARRILGQDPEQAADALAAIESTGRESLAEMRRVLGVLRSDDDLAELAPAPSLDDFDRLLRQFDEAGLPVELDVAGEARPLTPGLEMSAYRVVQESLTNSLKHAGPARAEVKLDYQDDALVVQVSDDGRGAAAPAGKGQGLIGMRERVEAFGGSLDAGPKAGGGYAVIACFPIGAP
jgi:signal transduction histidine kinase